MEANLITLNQAGHDGDSASSTLPARMESLELNTAADRKEDVSSKKDVAQASASPTLRGDGHEEQARNDTDGKGGNMKEQRAKKVSVEVKENDKDNKKKKSKSKSKKGGAKPSGFEEYFVDVPVTPDEYNEERSLYDHRKTVIERLQTAIHRYTARRKFDSFRKLVFDKFMAYGRVRTGPNPFTGGVTENDPNLTAAEISQLRAQHYFENGVEETSEVDFNTVVGGFLSSYLQQAVDLYEQEQIITAVGVVRNYLNYLLHHDVIPEYKSQVDAAKATCDLAEGQLWLCVKASRVLPGKFNESCSILWGGFYQDTYPRDIEAARQLDVLPEVLLPDAKKIFTSGLAAQASADSVKAYDEQMKESSYHIKRKFTGFFEVDKIIMADEYVRSMYKHPVSGGFPRVGKIKARTWYNPGAAPLDLTQAEKLEMEKHGRPIEHYEFILEDEVLDTMFPGIKIQATIYETSFGILYFDTITSVLCSFYTYLLNEDLIDWKPHRFLPQRETVPPPEAVPVEAHIVGPEGRDTVASLYGRENAAATEAEDGEDGATW